MYEGLYEPSDVLVDNARRRDVVGDRKDCRGRQMENYYWLRDYNQSELTTLEQRDLKCDVLSYAVAAYVS